MMQRSFRRVIPSGLKYGIRPAGAFSTESYTDKQEKTGRPLSPHVDIYKFPPTAVTSVSIRITGIALTAGLTGGAALSLLGADVPALASSLGNIPAIGQIAKFTVAFPIVFHYLGALRHLYWDNTPEALETDKVTQLSYIHGGLAVAMSAGLALVTLAPL